jgi:uncharacterized membrane protein
MFQLEKSLADWQKQGFITAETRQKILEFESKKSGSTWAVSGIVLLGIFVISVGLVSVIAANWFEIADWFKLLCGFSLMGLTGWFALKSYRSSQTLWFEGSLLAHALVILANIGLISQIFHTGGSLFKALLFWSVITFFIALVSGKLLLPLIWTSTFLVSAVWTLMDALVKSGNYEKWFSSVYLALPLVCYLMATITQKFPKISYSLKAAVLLSGLLGLWISEWLVNASSSYTQYGVYFVPSYILLATVGWLVKINGSYNKIQKYLIGCCIGFYLLGNHSNYFGIANSLILAVCTLIALGSMALLQSSLKNKKLFNIFLLLVGLRFLWLYFQALGGLATTGFGLITSGILIIGFAISWNRFKNKIQVWVEDKLK